MALKMRLPESHNDTQERFARVAKEGGYLHAEPPRGKPSALDRCLLAIGLILSALTVVGLAYRAFN